MRTVAVGPAEPADSVLIREWLPELSGVRSWTQVFIARHPQTGAVVGAAALVRGMQRFRTLLRVREAQHEREISTRLLDAVLAAARLQGAEAVYAWQGVAADSPALAVWRALGFITAEGVTVYEIDLRTVLADLEPL